MNAQPARCAFSIQLLFRLFLSEGARQRLCDQWTVCGRKETVAPKGGGAQRETMLEKMTCCTVGKLPGMPFVGQTGAVRLARNRAGSSRESPRFFLRPSWFCIFNHLRLKVSSNSPSQFNLRTQISRLTRVPCLQANLPTTMSARLKQTLRQEPPRRLLRSFLHFARVVEPTLKLNASHAAR